MIQNIEGLEQREVLAKEVLVVIVLRITVTLLVEAVVDIMVVTEKAECGLWSVSKQAVVADRDTLVQI